MKAWKTTRSTTLLAGLAACLLGLACASTGPPPPPEIQPGERKPYVIGIPDALRVTVWKNPELSVDVPVRSDGKISVPLIDDVQAEGLTPVELKEVISSALAAYITGPDVTVIVMQPLSKTVTVVGALRTSGSIPLVRETRVLEAIAAMGGFDVWADKDDVQIIRHTKGGQVIYHFNYGAFVAGKAPDSNILLQPGDTIVVPD